LRSQSNQFVKNCCTKTQNSSELLEPDSRTCNTKFVTADLSYRSVITIKFVKTWWYKIFHTKIPLWSEPTRLVCHAKPINSEYMIGWTIQISLLKSIFSNFIKTWKTKILFCWTNNTKFGHMFLESLGPFYHNPLE
jgi:hypothetical protein